MNKKICCIFGAGDFSSEHTIPDKAFVIAADGGLAHLEKLNITPDVILGDFDSYDMLNTNQNIVVFPKEKDYTDMFLAVKHAYELGYKDIYIYGGLGGSRFDHTFANIQLLEYFSKLGCKIILFGFNETITAISAFDNNSAHISINKSLTGYISLFALGGNVTGLNISGLKYELKDGMITTDFPLCTSNEFCNKEVNISISNGTLLIIINQKLTNL